MYLFPSLYDVVFNFEIYSTSEFHVDEINCFKSTYFFIFFFTIQNPVLYLWFDKQIRQQKKIYLYCIFQLQQRYTAIEIVKGKQNWLQVEWKIIEFLLTGSFYNRWLFI